MTLELCADSIESVALAAKYKLQRVELCSALSVGGLSPAYELTKACISDSNPEIHVMIRLREGSFVYSPREIELMLESIPRYAELGVHGVVFGCLDKDNNLQLDQLRLLADAAEKSNIEATLHRAFDFCANPFDSIEDLVALKITRILTSARFAGYTDQIENYRNLVKLSNKRIQIMAGSGLTVNNVLSVAQTGVDALHFTSHSLEGDLALGMGQQSIPNQFKLEQILARLSE